MQCACVRVRVRVHCRARVRACRVRFCARTRACVSLLSTVDTARHWPLNRREEMWISRSLPSERRVLAYDPKMDRHLGCTPSALLWH